MSTTTYCHYAQNVIVHILIYTLGAILLTAIYQKEIARGNKTANCIA